MRRTLVLLTAGLLAFSLAAPAAVVAAPGFTVQVAKPNHVNDTANIQAALDSCVAHGANCTVQLQAGTYLTYQLLVNDFHGAVVGAGQGKTVVQALPGYLVGPDIFGAPPSSSNPYPFIASFGGVSDVTMSDFTFRVTEFEPTKGWWAAAEEAFVTYLKGDVFLAGSGRFTRMSFEGAPGTDGYDATAVNVDSSVFVGNWDYAGGVLPGGAFSLTRSRVADTANGFEVVVFKGRATVGGSPADANTFANSSGGVFLNLDGAIAQETYNRVESTQTGFQGVAIGQTTSPAAPAGILLAHNSIVLDGLYMGGIQSWYDPGVKAPYLVVTNNDFRVGSGANGTSDGMDSCNLQGATVSGNTFTGVGGIAVFLCGSSSNNAVVANDLSHFTAGGAAQIVLDPAATHNLIVCRSRADTVYDQGTSNTVVGCRK